MREGDRDSTDFAIVGLSDPLTGRLSILIRAESRFWDMKSFEDFLLSLSTPFSPSPLIVEWKIDWIFGEGDF
jgi:hypothetical protein